MAYSRRLSHALHILVFIARGRQDELSSDRIGSSMHTNPVSVRQLMGRMRDAGLLNCVTGHSAPTLDRPASDISIWDVYRAVEGDKPLLHLANDVNPECEIGQDIQVIIGEEFERIHAAAATMMRSITLQDILDRFDAVHGA